MIDTVRFTTDREFVNGIEFSGTQKLKGLLPNSPAAKHIRIVCAGKLITKVEASLPKVLSANNRKPIRRTCDIQTALQLIDTLLDQISIVRVKAPRSFLRIDLAWTYIADPLTFFHAHREVNHPSFRAKMITYRNTHKITGVEWQGDRIRIKLYDKTKKKSQKASVDDFILKMLRVEIQLRGRQLREQFNGLATEKVENLKIAKCYEVFRRILMPLKPDSIPIVSSKDEALLVAEKNGMQVFDFLSQFASSQTVRRLRQKAHGWRLKQARIDWEWMLPKKFPPPQFAIQRARKKLMPRRLQSG